MPDRTRPAPEYLLLGEILRPHGVRGELRMRLLTDYPERIDSLEKIYLGSGPEDSRAQKYPVQHMRMHKNYGLLKLESISDRNQADRLRGLFVMVKLEDAVPLEEDEFYFYQLMGLSVQTEAGDELGTISDVLETGANDVYIVDSPDHGQVLIPATEETIIEIDIEGGVLTVNLPEGLLPE